MDKTTSATLLVLFVAGLVGATPFLIDQTSLNTYEKRFNASLVVEEPKPNTTSLGVNADRTLDFGKMSPNTNATKFLNVSSGKKSLLNIKSEGNISEIMHHENRFYFQGDKEMPIEARAKKPGNYTGTVSLHFRIPENRIGSKWLDLQYKIQGFF